MVKYVSLIPACNITDPEYMTFCTSFEECWQVKWLKLCTNNNQHEKSMYNYNSVVLRLGPALEF